MCVYQRSAYVRSQLCHICLRLYSHTYSTKCFHDSSGLVVTARPNASSSLFVLLVYGAPYVPYGTCLFFPTVVGDKLRRTEVPLRSTRLYTAPLVPAHAPRTSKEFSNTVVVCSVTLRFTNSVARLTAECNRWATSWWVILSCIFHNCALTDAFWSRAVLLLT